MTDDVLRDALAVLHARAAANRTAPTDAELGVTALLVSILRDDVHLDPHVHDALAHTVWCRMNIVQRAQMKQLLFHGPVADGDVLSKAARSDLIAMKLATRCCIHGEAGYTAATYMARTVYTNQTGEHTA